jgi:hypothetical protein
MESTIATRTALLATARRWRRNRLHASKAGEKCRARLCSETLVSLEGDTGIEPAIKNVSKEIEEDDKTGKHKRHCHDNGGIICKD